MAGQAEPNHDDESLMALIQQGDRQAFAHLLRRHGDKFFRLAWRLTSDEAEAEDIVQESFLKLWDRPEIYKARPGVQFTSWFYRVVSNAALDRMRRRKYSSPLDQPDAFESGDEAHDEALIRRQREAALEEALATLPEKQKLALTLCFYEGVSNKDAAQIMQVSVKALESLLMRAKRGVRDYMLRAGLIEEEEGR